METAKFGIIIVQWNVQTFNLECFGYSCIGETRLVALTENQQVPEDMLLCGAPDIRDQSGSNYPVHCAISKDDYEKIGSKAPSFRTAL